MGIEIDDQERKQTMFSGDGTFLTDRTEKSFKSLIYTLTDFGKMSSIKFNIKQEGHDGPRSLTWIMQPIFKLGLEF